MGQPLRAWCSQSPAGPAGVSGMQEIAPCDAPALTLRNVGFFQIERLLIGEYRGPLWVRHRLRTPTGRVRAKTSPSLS